MFPRPSSKLNDQALSGAKVAFAAYDKISEELLRVSILGFGAMAYVAKGSTLTREGEWALGLLLLAGAFAIVSRLLLADALVWHIQWARALADEDHGLAPGRRWHLKFIVRMYGITLSLCSLALIEGAVAIVRCQCSDLAHVCNVVSAIVAILAVIVGGQFLRKVDVAWDPALSE